MKKRFQINNLARSGRVFRGWSVVKGSKTPVFVAESRQAREVVEKEPFKSTT
jgi:hypothetical protein